MNTIQNLFQQAQLAEAAYANLWDSALNQPITADAKVKAALIANKFSDAQATEFLTHWRVVEQLPDTHSGFSATLFESIDNPGNYAYAIRGTAQPLQDLLLADGQGIVRNGLAMNQIVDMYNDWQRINTATGSSYQAAQLITLQAETNALNQHLIPLDDLRARTDIIVETTTQTTFLYPFVENIYTVKSIRYINSSQLTDASLQTGAGGSTSLKSNVLDVTGHSLGGHLASAFTRLFSGPVNATTINGAGFPTGYISGLGGNADINIANLFGMLGGAAAFNPAAITNIHGDGTTFVSMNSQYGLIQPGASQEIYIETVTPSLSNRTGNLFGHGAGQMTDSLALYAQFAKLDPSLDTASLANLNTISDILKTESNVANRSLENTLDALRKLFDSNASTLTGINNREAYYANLKTLQNSIDCFAGSYTLRDLTTFDAAQLKSIAQDNLAYRYALTSLDSFVLLGNDALYAQHNTHGELDLYDPVTGQGQLTTDYLNDRADMLSLMMQRNIADSSTIISGDILYQDVEQNIILRSGSHSTDDQFKKIVFGGTGDNSLKGGIQADRLYGMNGNDKLEGGKGDDLMMGGAGDDTYIINTGDGNDTIEDKQGNNTVIFNGKNLGVFYRTTGGTSYTNADGNLTALLQNGDFIITDARNGQTVTLNKNFTEGDFGIHFKDAPIDPPTTNVQIFNPLPGQDLWTTIYHRTDELGADFLNFTPLFDLTNNQVLASESAMGLMGLTSGNDNYTGSDGNEMIINQIDGGNDTVDGGAGHDYVITGTGNDILIGGAGSDLLIAGVGDDRLYGEAQSSTADAIAVSHPKLLAEIFDSGFYGRDPISHNRDFLSTLINDQIKLGYSDANGLLIRFVTDIDKLTQYDTHLRDGALSKALIDVAIADYYLMQNGFSGKYFFTARSGGIEFNLADISTNWSSIAVNRLDTAIINQLLNGDLKLTIENYHAGSMKYYEAANDSEFLIQTTRSAA